MGDEEMMNLGEEDTAGGAVLIRIHVPDLNIHKCLQFYRHDLVWDVKQQCLASLPKVTEWFWELKESFNYGLYAPPCNGKAGKFLEEERPLADYPFSGPVGYLELRYKRRLYKGLNVDEKQLKSLHSKSNLRRFLDYVHAGQCDKINKLCSKGLDPNFHCPESGETPLTMSAVMKKPSKLLITLVNGGALLDFRTKDGSTAMHRAVECKNLDSVKTLLDLGGSPNYRDAKGLTPLYLSVVTNADPIFCQSLLHDHAYLGAQDMQGWHETHQACRNGLAQHLEHLLYYGADMNARNASGNTPLHVCAVNNQESCARLLLFRGADKEALNYANQTPYQVAVIAGNMELAEIIQNHKAQDVVPYREVPKYNPKRRSYISQGLLDPRLKSSLTTLSLSGGSARTISPPPSPCLSSRSVPPFSSASSSLSECSVYTPSESCSSCSSASHFGSEDNSAITDKSLDHSDITSDSSGVGTCNSGGSGGSYDATPTDPALVLPGMMVMCVENFDAKSPEHLKLAEGDIIEVTGSTDTGMLEGSLRGDVGLFPAACVQEIRMKSYESRNHVLSAGKKGKKEDNCSKGVPRLKKMYVLDNKTRWGEPHTVILHRGQKGFGFVLRGAKADSPLMELQPSDRFPALQYLDDVDENGVADRAGLRKGDFILAINGEDVSQLSHEVVVDVIKKSGDLVSLTVVGLSRPTEFKENSKPGSPASLTCDQGGTPKTHSYHFATLPRKYSGSNGPNVPSPPRRDPSTSLSVGRARAKSMVAALADLGVGANHVANSNGNSGGDAVGTKSNSVDSISGKPPLPTSCQNGTVTSNGTLSHGKTASLKNRGVGGRVNAQDLFDQKTHSVKLSANGHKIYASVSEMKKSKSGGKGKDLLGLHKDFHSTPDLKTFLPPKSPSTSTTSNPVKSRSQENLSGRQTNRHSWACVTPGLADSTWKNVALDSKSKRKTDGHESDTGSVCSTSSSSSSTCGKKPEKTSKSPAVLTEGEYRTIKPLRPIQSKTLPRRSSAGASMGSVEQQTIVNMVPPGQVIKVDVSKSKEYSNLDDRGTIGAPPVGGVMSSFKPNDSAKLYASPDDLKTIGYREGGAEGSGGTLKKARSQSVPRKEVDYARPETCENMNGVKPSEVKKLNTFNASEFDPQKSLQEAKDKLKPVKPALKSSLTNTGNAEPTKIRIEVKQSPRLVRKAEKTVTFQAESPPPGGTNNTAATNGTSSAISHSMSVDELQKVKTSLKSSKSFPNDLTDENNGEGGNNAATTEQTTPMMTSGGEFVTCLPVNPDSDSSEDSSDKTWILKDENNGPSSSASDSVQTVISNPAVIAEQKVENKAPMGNVPSNNLDLGRNLSAVSQLGVTQHLQQKQMNYMHQQQHQVQQNVYGTLGARPNVRVAPAKSSNRMGESGGEMSEAEEKGGRRAYNPSMYHTLQPQRSKSMLTGDMTGQLTPQQQQQQQMQHQYMMQQRVLQMQQQRQGEKSIEESLKLIHMHVAALKQDYPNANNQHQHQQSASPVDFNLRNQTPILEPPPEFSDARDTHEQATRFNQSHLHPSEGGHQPFNRQSPMYRSISHSHSSASSMYSGYPTMTRAQYQQQMLHQQQQAYSQQQQQQQAHGGSGGVMAMSMPTYQTLGRTPSNNSYSGNGSGAQNLLNHQQANYAHYGTLGAPRQAQAAAVAAAAMYQQQQHHPKCHYYQQGQPPPQQMGNSVQKDSNKHINEKLHPVHRYTPDIYESNSGPRIVGTIPKQKQVSDHYEVPHSHQQLLQAQQAAVAQQHAVAAQQQQQQHASGGNRVRREFRNKNLPDWTLVDACDWLDSLFMPEYKVIFQQRGIDGKKLMRMDNSTLLELGVKKLGHRMNIEKSLKRYLPQGKS